MKCIGTAIAILLFATYGHASYKEALDLYQMQKYSESLKMCADILVTENDLTENSPNFKIRFLAAHVHWKMGNKMQVISHLRRCMEIRKNDVSPYIDMSLFLVEIKQYNDAEMTALNGLRIEQSPMLYYALGKISLMRSNFWRAKELFEKVNSMNQDFYFSYNSLGIALVNLKKYGEANTAFTVAAALNPDSPQILNNLGISYEMMGKQDKAYECFQKANALDKENRTILANMERAKKETVK